MDGKDYGEGSASQGRGLANGELYLRGNGIYWINFAADGTEKLTIYPTPEVSGLPIAGLCVVEPAELTDANKTLKLPIRFRMAPADYAAGIAFGAEEDNPELRAFHEEEFDRAVADLNMLRLSRERRGPAQFQIEGIHF